MESLECSNLLQQGLLFCLRRLDSNPVLCYKISVDSATQVEFCQNCGRIPCAVDNTWCVLFRRDPCSQGRAMSALLCSIFNASHALVECSASLLLLICGKAAICHLFFSSHPFLIKCCVMYKLCSWTFFIPPSGTSFLKNRGL